MAVRARYCCDPREVNGAKPVMKKCRPQRRIGFRARRLEAHASYASKFGVLQDQTLDEFSSATWEGHQVHSDLTQVAIQPWLPKRSDGRLGCEQLLLSTLDRRLAQTAHRTHTFRLQMWSTNKTPQLGKLAADRGSASSRSHRS